MTPARFLSFIFDLTITVVILAPWTWVVRIAFDDPSIARVMVAFLVTVLCWGVVWYLWIGSKRRRSKA